MKRSISFFIISVLCVSGLCQGALAEELLIPVGEISGLELSNDTVTVAAFDDAAGSTARDAGLQIGDEILSVAGRRVSCAQDVRESLSGCAGAIPVVIRRDGKQRELTVLPDTSGDTPGNFRSISIDAQRIDQIIDPDIDRRNFTHNHLPFGNFSKFLI